jgi:Protein of unknown function (DUF3769)/Lipopolysaccharide-assembly, LptC-related
MGSNNVGKKSHRDVAWRIWKVARYLLLLSYYSIGISLRPALAGESSPIAIPVNLAPARKSAPLTYTVVQNGENSPPTTNITAPNGTIELNAEQQEFNNNTQIITANGKVVVRFNKAILQSDRLRVNLKTKIATAEGNVSLIRGKQILYGSQFEYNFDEDRGRIVQARGDIYQPTLVRDLNIATPATTTLTVAGEKPFSEPLLSDRLRDDQPVTNIRNTGSIGVTTNDRDIEYQPTLKPSGTITRVRFQADKIDFNGDRVTAEKVRITNDPFSPPELQIKADRAQFKTVNSEEDEVTLSNPRINVENNFDIPIPRDRFVLNKLGKDADNNNPLGSIGYDDTERGGVYVQTSFYPIFDRRFRLTITPQYFLQRAVSGFKIFDPSAFGVKTNIEGNLGSDTTIQASAALAGFDLNNFSNNFRGLVAVKQNLSLFSYPHLFTGQAAYRQQVFNGSLGYQDVQSSIGGILTSSKIPIGQTGINFDYQIGAQLVSANTDRQNLIGTNTSPSLVTLSRYETATNLTKSFRLWEGKGLPADNKETYNYSPTPVVPYIQLNTGIRGGYTSYSDGESQSFVGYNVGIQGQFGNFSKSSFDYTGFNLNYYQQFPSLNSSPFLFDRLVNNRVLSAGINQQISGPFRLGIQSSLDLNSGQQISTDYYLEYSRRTYNFVIRYNPVLGLGSIGFRLNDFNWDGVTPGF